MPVDRCCIDISIEYAAWEDPSLCAPYTSWDAFFESITLHVFSSLKAETIANKNPYISVLLTDNATIQQLNLQFRGKDSPTNVLSFPSPSSMVMSDDILGDLAFSFDVIKDEAEKDHKSFLNHMTHLTIHGILHLRGYDHIQDEDAEEMENLEIDLLSTLNIPNPYR